MSERIIGRRLSQDEKDELFTSLARQVTARYSDEYAIEGLLYGRSNPKLLSDCAKSLSWLAESIYAPHAELHEPKETT